MYKVLLGVSVLALATPLAMGRAAATETITYQYDALGRLVEVQSSGTVNNGQSVTTTFDAAGNRTNYAVNGVVIAPVNLTVGAASVTEGGNLVFTVTRSGNTSIAASASYATASGTAASGSDFAAASGTVSFAAGETSKTITVATTDDAAVESAETMTVTLSAPSANTTITTATATGTINDNDAAAATLAIGAASITEGGNLVFTVTRSGNTSIAASASYATAGGTATSGSDFTAASGTVSFAAGETSKTITVATADDAAIESAETMTVTLSAPLAHTTITTATATGTINDNDAAAATLAIGAASITEGGNLVFTVTRSGNTSIGVGVSYATASGTATSGSDFTAAAGNVEFLAGQTSKTITVATIDDAVVESAETMTVTLSAPSANATITTASGTGTINDNDSSGTANLAISDASTTEGGNLTFTVTLSQAIQGTVDVTYVSSNGTAVGGADYTPASGTLTFAAGQTSKTILVETLDDSIVEPTETMGVALTGANVTITSGNGGVNTTDSTGVGTINDNDAAAATLAIGAASITEGGNLVFTVTRSGNTSIAASASYATASGTAASGSDFTAASGTVSFAAGQTSKTITVATIDDAAVESAETMTVTLSAPSANTTITTATATGTINDNDVAAATVAIGTASVTEGGNLVFTVTRSGNTSIAASVSYATSGGTATSGSDFTAASGTVSFAAGETSKAIVVATIDDALVEGNEVIAVTLSGPSANTTITTANAVGTIVDNDSAGGGGSIPYPTTTNTVPDSEHMVGTASNDHFINENYLSLMDGFSGNDYFVMKYNNSSAWGGAGVDVFDIREDGKVAGDDRIDLYGDLVSTNPTREADYFVFDVTKWAGAGWALSPSYNWAVITDFDNGLDKIAILNASATTFAGLTLTQSGADAVISASGMAKITLRGRNISILDASDFIFSASGGNSATLAIGAASITEGGNLVFTVTRSGNTAIAASASYASASGTATSGSDFTAASGTVSFAAGETSKTITVATTDDSTVEPAETMTVTLSAPSTNTTITTPSGTGTINDNDVAAPTLAIGNASVTEGGSLVFTITRSGSTTGTSSASYATANATATAGSDYTAASGTVTFTAGQTSKTITVATTDDAAVESAETLTVTMSSPVGATITTGTGTGTINDNDVAAATLAIGAASTTEGGSLVFTVTRSGNTSIAASASYATSSGTATSGSDFIAASGTVSFAAGQTSKPITVATTDDAAVESSETMTVILSGPSANTTITASSAVGTIVDNDSSGGGSIPYPTTTNTVPDSDDMIGTSANDYFLNVGYLSILQGYGGSDYFVMKYNNSAAWGGAGVDVLDIRELAKVAGDDQIDLYGNLVSANPTREADHFVFDVSKWAGAAWALSPSYDWAVITDFDNGLDKIAILNASATSFAGLTLTQTGSDAVISASGMPKITLRGRSTSILDASDFIFSASGGAP